MDCGRGLCDECVDAFDMPICPACNLKRIRGEKFAIQKELVLTLGVGLLGMYLFHNMGIIPPEGIGTPVQDALLQLTFFYMFCSIVPGWKTLSALTPRVFLFLPLIGWVIYFVLKLWLALVIGPIMLPIRAYRSIKRYKVLQQAYRVCAR